MCLAAAILLFAQLDAELDVQTARALLINLLGSVEAANAYLAQIAKEERKVSQ
jgi:hypothetical protein